MDHMRRAGRARNGGKRPKTFHAVSRAASKPERRHSVIELGYKAYRHEAFRSRGLKSVEK